MDYKGIIITGTSGSGKSTVARELCLKHRVFEITQAVTTRPLRKDDIPGEYQHIDDEEFKRLDTEGKLLIKSDYRGYYYGITHEAFQQVINGNKIPLLLITPKSAKEFAKIENFTQSNEQLLLLTFFFDASDNILDNRLIQRGDESTDKELRQKDREYKKNCLYAIEKKDEKKTEVGTYVDLIWSLWEYKNTGGIIPKRLIKLMIDCGMLLEYADTDKITGAAYDLSIGDEYYYGGKINILSDNEPFILIEPYDYAIVTSKEIVNFPRDITARFDLSVSLFCQGIILSNGPQVDPGFNGRLFCLLFNTSNAPVFLKREQHYATLEFHKLIEPTTSYEGKYQGKDKIIYYLPSNTMRGAINELKKELEVIRTESRNLQDIFIGVITLILAILAILLVIR